MLHLLQSTVLLKRRNQLKGRMIGVIGVFCQEIAGRLWLLSNPDL